MLQARCREWAKLVSQRPATARAEFSPVFDPVLSKSLIVDQAGVFQPFNHLVDDRLGYFMAFQVLSDFSTGVIPLVEQSQRSGVRCLYLVVRGQQGDFLLAELLTDLQPGRHNAGETEGVFTVQVYAHPVFVALLRDDGGNRLSQMVLDRFWYRKIKSRDLADAGHG